MKVTEHISSSEGALFSLEILPPAKGQGIDLIFENLDILMDFQPHFVNVTSHREQYEYKKRPDGSLIRKTVKKTTGHTSRVYRHHAQVQGRYYSSHYLWWV